ncbi:MAG: hypothetical protein AB1938_13480 [Myxococcota bacterium]
MTTSPTSSRGAWHAVACAFCQTSFAFKGRAGEPPCVACPGCGRYQPSMLDAARLQRFGGFTLIAGLFALLGLLVAAVEQGYWFVNLVNSPAVLFQLLALALYVGGRLLAERSDPNADAATRVGTREPHVVLREEFETARELARHHGAALPALEWRQPTPAPTQPPALA